MNNDYRDIIEKIDEVPQWWDEHAVPRFCEFRPFKSANIYAESVVLTEIACQNCDRKFRVAFSETKMERYLSWRQWKNADEVDEYYTDEVALENSLEGGLKKHGFLHYGDPPNYCCGAGATMNSIPLRVLEWWERDKDPRAWFNDDHGFIRRRDLEIEFDDPFGEEGRDEHGVSNP